MGRAFEYRRAAKEKRWGKMSRVFPKLSKAITVAAREGGPSIETNSKLRIAIQNAKAENMPKDNIENAIKRATDKSEKGYIEIIYEGYGPFGVAVIVECSTDNQTRTVANVRSYFNKVDGALSKSGSVDYLFDRKAVFRVDANSLTKDDLELDLIDFGLEEIHEDEGEFVILTPYEAFGEMQIALESRNIPVIKATLERFPSTTVKVNSQQEAAIGVLLDKLDDDDDVQAFFHNMETEE